MKRLFRPLSVALLAACAEAPAPPPPAVPETDAAASTAPLPDSVLTLDPAAGAWRARELTHLPRYFLPSGWVSADTLWGLAGSTPVLAQVERPEYHALEGRYWDASLAPGGRLAGIDERGVWTGRRATPRLLVERGAAVPGLEGDLSGPLVWSPDGAHLLLRWVREGPAHYAVADAATGALTPLPARAGELFLGEPFGWTAPGEILFQAHPSFDPERGPVGRGELAVYRLADRSLRRMAAAPEGVFLRPLAAWGEGRVLVGESETGLGRPLRYRLYDTRDWSHRPIELPPADRVEAHDPARALLVIREDDSRAPLHRVLLREGGAAPRPLLHLRGRDVRLHWSPDGRRLAVGAAIEEADGGSSHRSWIVERIAR